MGIEARGARRMIAVVARPMGICEPWGFCQASYEMTSRCECAASGVAQTVSGAGRPAARRAASTILL